MPVDTVLIALTLIVGFYMAWSIGANDVANAMGTSVGSGALTLRRAVLIAAVLEFSGSFFFGARVSETLQSGIIKADMFEFTPMLLGYGMLSALLATGLWLQLASYFGWPVSTTHAIVGGVVGFGVLAGGVDAVYWDNVSFILSSWILSPLLGGIVSYLIFNLLRRKVLYTADPITEAKKITPLFVFIVAMTLSLIMFLKGFQNLSVRLPFLGAFVISLLIGAIAAGISYFFLQRIKKSPAVVQSHPYSSEMYIELEKAKKHLQQVVSASPHDVAFQVSTIMQEVDQLSRSFKQSEDSKGRSAEYKTVERIFGYLQIMSACLMAFAHGANDVANAIGPLSAALAVFTTQQVIFQPEVPTWQLALGGIGIVVGLATWGWRVILTIGKKITELTPTRGFSAEFGCAATVLFATAFGMPISTTHTLVGSVFGVGLARGIEALNLGMTRDIIISWVVTVPISAALTMGFFYTITEILGPNPY